MGGPINPIETYRDGLNAVFEKHGVVLAYLYGSQARGKAGPLSDVDIAVLFAREVPGEERFDRWLRVMGDLMDVFRRDDVYVFDLDQGTPLLNYNVRIHGKLLYCSDEKIRLDFLLRALQRYVDTVPLRRQQNRYLRIKIQSGLFGRAIPITRTH